MYEEYSQDEIILAQDIAHQLRDYDSMPYHLQNARKYKEAFFRTQLEAVLAIPNHKIRNSRAAYYVFLINHKATQMILGISTNTRLVGTA
jgi:hypothetical protein